MSVPSHNCEGLLRGHVDSCCVPEKIRPKIDANTEAEIKTVDWELVRSRCADIVFSVLQKLTHLTSVRIRTQGVMFQDVALFQSLNIISKLYEENS
jgi:hypothetical protein